MKKISITVLILTLTLLTFVGCFDSVDKESVTNNKIVKDDINSSKDKNKSVALTVDNNNLKLNLGIDNDGLNMVEDNKTLDIQVGSDNNGVKVKVGEDGLKVNIGDADGGVSINLGSFLK